ncbi:MAG: indolepyruvate oxidoreductase subunit beta [Oligosphaeraceae bacterium]
MKCDIVLAGVGGQGILTIAAILGKVAVAEKLHVKQSEIHGMSQRGGSVFAHLRLSSQPIFADQITPGTADMVVAMEPMEALRHRASLAPQGILITDKTPLVNIPDYPQETQIQEELRAMPRTLLLDTTSLAKDSGNPRNTNVVLLGAIANFLGLDATILEKAIQQHFASKGDAVVQAALQAFRLGKEAKSV